MTPDYTINSLATVLDVPEADAYLEARRVILWGVRNRLLSHPRGRMPAPPPVKESFSAGAENNGGSERAVSL